MVTTKLQSDYFSWFKVSVLQCIELQSILQQNYTLHTQFKMLKLIVVQCAHILRNF